MSNDDLSAAARGSDLSDGLGPAVKSAMLDPACQRLRDWALIGPVQRAEIESFAERLLAAERERYAKLCDEQERQWLEAARLCGGDDGNEVCRANMAAELAAEIRAQRRS